MGAASIVTEAIQSGISWGSMAMENKAIYDEMKFNKAVAENNAGIAENNARDAVSRGEGEREILAAQGRIAAGGIRTQGAKSNVAMDSGSPLAILAGARAMNEYDQKMTTANANREAWQWRNKKQEIETQQKLDERRAYYKTAGNFLQESSRAVGSAGNIVSSGMGK